jgi:hypothetical protein
LNTDLVRPNAHAVKSLSPWDPRLLKGKEVAVRRTLRSLKGLAGAIIGTIALGSLGVTSAFAAGPAKHPYYLDANRLQHQWSNELSQLRFDRNADNPVDWWNRRGRQEWMQFRWRRYGDNGEYNRILQDAESLASSHPGFDNNGVVTDVHEARSTVRTMRGYLDQLNNTLADHPYDPYPYHPYQANNRPGQGHESHHS